MLRDESRVIAPASALLPPEYRAPEILSAISWDGQVYARLGRKRGEARVESWDVPRLHQAREFDMPLEVWATMRRSGMTRKRRKRLESGNVDWPERVVRHLRHERRRCPECGHEELAIHFAWAERRCSACWSACVQVLDATVEPARPDVLGNTGEPFIAQHNPRMPDTEGHIWGHAPDDDAMMLRNLQHSYRYAPHGHAHLYLLLLFGLSLADLPQYAEGKRAAMLTLNLGNVAWRYFQLTEEPGAARRALDLYERTATLMDDPVPVSLAKHSFAMAAIDVLRVLGEPEAELATRRSDLRGRAIAEVRDAIRLADQVTAHDPQGAWQQQQRMHYAEADLLASGRATSAERGESSRIFDALSAEHLGALGFMFRATRAEARLRSLPRDVSDDELAAKADAALELIELIRADEPAKLEHRWRWALAVGEFLLHVGERLEAQYCLESAVTFILKDTRFRSEPLTATADAERYQRAFGLLAGCYSDIGWWFEALCLLETYRGRVLELSALTDAERTEREVEAERARLDRYYGQAKPHGSRTEVLVEEQMLKQIDRTELGPFHDDYVLPGLSDRLLALFDQLDDEETVLLSLSVDDTTLEDRYRVSAVFLGPPRTPPRPGRSRSWMVDTDVLRALTSDVHRRPGSFRESRLMTLGHLAFEHLLAPIQEELQEFACRRVLLVTPSSLSNLPFEAFSPADDAPPTGALPVHFAFTPSFQFRSGRPPSPARTGEERLLIVGYEGRDLPNADREAATLTEIFGERADYLPGAECTKKRVVEALNGDYDFVHVICHGTYDDRQPRESSLHFRGTRSADAYRLRAAEIRDLVRFRRTPVVTLSACSTALTADSRSNTWHGLPGSLLESGARCVIGTRWPIADRAAEEVMGRLYTLISSTDRSPAACLHAVQDELRAVRDVEEWACFGYLGSI